MKPLSRRTMGAMSGFGLGSYTMSSIKEGQPINLSSKYWRGYVSGYLFAVFWFYVIAPPLKAWLESKLIKTGDN